MPRLVGFGTVAALSEKQISTRSAAAFSPTTKGRSSGGASELRQCRAAQSH